MSKFTPPYYIEQIIKTDKGLISVMRPFSWGMPNSSRFGIDFFISSHLFDNFPEHKPPKLPESPGVFPRIKFLCFGYRWYYGEKLMEEPFYRCLTFKLIKADGS